MKGMYTLPGPGNIVGPMYAVVCLSFETVATANFVHTVLAYHIQYIKCMFCTTCFSADGLLGLGVLGGALLVGGVVAAGAVALAGMGIAKLKK